MASYITYLGEKQILIEAPVSGGLAKSESEVKPDPARAISNIIDTIKAVAEHVGQEMGPVLRKTGAAFELNFAVRSDSFGLVMISESAQVGQFQVTVKWPPMRPAAPPPAAPRPAALPQHDQD
jgi:hypothetical protein